MNNHEIKNIMNNHEIKNIIYDLNPKNCLTKFQNPSPRYALELVVICYGITILLSAFIQDSPTINFHKQVLVEIPINIFNSTVLNPILEEILFFGIPIALTNNPIVILGVGFFWPIFHLFAPLNVETFYLSLSAFLTTLPVLFIHFKIWKSGLGWISIIVHSGYNVVSNFVNCHEFTTCSNFNNNNFDFPEFHIFLGITVFSIVIVYYLQRKKEEREYVEKILRKNIQNFVLLLLLFHHSRHKMLMKHIMVSLRFINPIIMFAVQ